MLMAHRTWFGVRGPESSVRCWNYSSQAAPAGGLPVGELSVSGPVCCSLCSVRVSFALLL